MMVHTKGPWRAERQKSFSYSIHTDYAHDRGHDHNIVREVRCEANAFLIAAAPELLEATKALARAYEQLIPGIGKIACQDYAVVNEAPILARKAIAKAEGRLQQDHKSISVHRRPIDMCADAEWQGGE